MAGGMEIRRDEFEAWMKRQGLSPKTISNNLAYVDKCAESLDRPIDEIVRSEELMAAAIRSLGDQLSVADASKASYVGGFLKYCQFVNDGRRFHGKVVSKCSSWYQEVIVDEVPKFLEIVRKLNSRQSIMSYDRRSWAFRGQGETSWELESSLGRIVEYQKHSGESVGKRLKMFEREAMWSFRREVSHYPEYHGFEGVDMLALMQHYECKTRLLDFTMTPLVALFMALEQNEQLYRNGVAYAERHLCKTEVECERPSFAVWAVDLNALCGYDQSLKSGRTVEEVWCEADEIIRGNENNNVLGIKVVFPSKCSKRISAQDGLFLMATNLAESFERNLREELSGLRDADIVPVDLSSLTDNGLNRLPPVCKFVFDGSLREEVKVLLREANITAKTAFPDLTGLGRFVSGVIQEHGEH